MSTITVHPGPERSGRLLASVTGEPTGQSGITTVVDRTGASLTFTVTDRPVILTFDEPYLAAVTNTVTATVIMTDAAGAAIPALIGGGWTRVLAAAASTNVHCVGVISTPGTYTVKMRVSRTGSGTVTVGLGAISTAWYYLFTAIEG